MKTDLEERGVAVIPNVISSQDCDQYIEELRSWLATFGEGRFPDNIHSLIHGYGIAHHSAVWKARLKAKAVFAELWDTQKLHSSIDGVAIGRPPEKDEDSNGKLHLDQGPSKKGLHAYQGAVHLEECTEEDWCISVIEKSHKLHDEYFSKFPTKSKSDFCTLTEPAKKWFSEQGCAITRISVPKGGIVLWDSRTVYASAPPRQGRTNKDKWRFVTFVSMTPAIWSSKEDNEERLHGYQTMRSSRHWSSQGFKLYGVRKPTKWDIRELQEVAKTTEARLLVGDLEYDFGDGQSNGPKYKPVGNGPKCKPVGKVPVRKPYKGR